MVCPSTQAICTVVLNTKNTKTKTVQIQGNILVKQISRMLEKVREVLFTLEGFQIENFELKTFKNLFSCNKFFDP